MAAIICFCIVAFMLGATVGGFQQDSDPFDDED